MSLPLPMASPPAAGEGRYLFQRRPPCHLLHRSEVLVLCGVWNWVHTRARVQLPDLGVVTRLCSDGENPPSYTLEILCAFLDACDPSIKKLSFYWTRASKELGSDDPSAGSREQCVHPASPPQQPRAGAPHWARPELCGRAFEWGDVRLGACQVKESVREGNGGKMQRS